MKKYSDKKRKVFVVYGRDVKIQEAMFAFLQSIGLRPLEWPELIKATGQGSPYVGDVISNGFSIAQAAVVLMTPDDEAQLREHLRNNNEKDSEITPTPQPRQNVIFEAGMALGLYPKRTILVEFGRLRPISDVDGRHTIRMDGSIAKRQELAQRLKTAGCNVNLDGILWHNTGDFSITGSDSIPTISFEKRDEEKVKNSDENNTTDPAMKLAKYCTISKEKLSGILSINSKDSIEISAELKGSDTVKQIDCTSMILLANEICFGERVTKSSTIIDSLRLAGVHSLPNLAKNLRMKKNLFVPNSSSKATGYSLTTGVGRKFALDLIRKLANGE